MIDTALATFYAMPTLLGAFAATLAILYALLIPWCIIQALANALGSRRLWRWVALRAQYIGAWWQRRRHGDLYAAPRLVIRGIHSGRCSRTIAAGQAAKRLGRPVGR